MKAKSLQAKAVARELAEAANFIRRTLDGKTVGA
jgi:hypothetical protein